MQGHVTVEQFDMLRKPINTTRISKRSQGGKQLSYLESWDVRAHLIRTFGFGGFDSETLGTHLMFQRDVKIGPADRPEQQKDGVEVAYLVTMRLTVRDPFGDTIAVYSESAVGSASGAVGYGDLHDNALKTAASDALKRCAINLGNQFGLSLYDKGSTEDVVKRPLITPKGWIVPPPGDAVSDEARQRLADTLGATVVDEGRPTDASASDGSAGAHDYSDGPPVDDSGRVPIEGAINTTAQAQMAAKKAAASKATRSRS